MVLLFSLIGVLLAGLMVAVLIGKVAAPGVPEPEDTTSFTGLQDREMTAADLDEVRFDSALRGYRMDQVDSVLGRAARELRWTQEEVQRLRRELDDVEDVDSGSDPAPAQREDGVPQDAQISAAEES